MAAPPEEFIFVWGLFKFTPTFLLGFCSADVTLFTSFRIMFFGYRKRISDYYSI